MKNNDTINKKEISDEEDKTLIEHEEDKALIEHEKYKIASRLKVARKDKGFTQKEVAKKLGIAQPTYGNYEVGTREPDLETLKKLSKIYNVNLSYLLGESTYKKKEISSLDFKLSNINSYLEYDDESTSNIITVFDNKKASKRIYLNDYELQMLDKEIDDFIAFKLYRLSNEEGRKVIYYKEGKPKKNLKNPLDED